jgi:hypothetical protein
MASNIGDIRAKVTPRLQDAGANLSATPGGDVDVAIQAAVGEYQREHPLEKAVRIAGSGAFKYAISGLTGFVDGSSGLLGVAYPHATTDQFLNFLEDDAFGIVRDDTGAFLWFVSARPATGEFFLVVFTAPHTVSATVWTPPASDDEALADLATAYCFQLLAGRYSQETESSISADVVNRLTKAAEARANARIWREAYASKMSSGSSGSAAVAMGDIDRFFGTQQGHDYFFHGGRRH